ncbi:MAG: PHP domain-containing protein [Clostridiales bacterium]|nr:PHP domain-containing protein [Clostridiales bacterium]
MISHDIHIHTHLSSCSSDPEATPENYIRLAKELGIEVLGFSDHFWDSNVEGASDWYRPQNFEHIMQIKDMMPEDTLGVKVLIGCETEYCGDGKLGITREVAEKLDFVLVPTSHVHMKGFTVPAWINKPKDVANIMVEYFKDVTQYDFVTGLAHPFYPLSYKNVDEIVGCISDEELQECFGMAQEADMSIEINTCNLPSTKDAETDLYHDDVYINMYNIAKKMGCKFHLGTDAHSIGAFSRNTRLKESVEKILGLTNEDIHPIVTGAVRK